MLADTKTLIEPARTVLEERTDLVRNHRLEIGIVLAGSQRLAFEKGNRFVQNREVAGRFHIVCDCVSQPYPIV